MVDPMVRFPCEDTLRWAEAVLGLGWRIVGGRRLTGGISSSMHRLAVVGPSGRGQVVLRRWIGTNRDEARALVQRESLVLSALATTAVPAPRVLAWTFGEDAGGDPALLMTRERGHVHLAPRDPSSWLRQMAVTLAAIHDLDVTLPLSPPWTGNVMMPEWTSKPAAVRAALKLIAEPPPDFTPRFVHGDYQHFNMLWSRERLRAVVDWTFPATGAADGDLAHCRRNLTILFSADWAEEFRLAYEAECGRTVHPWFDLRALTSYGASWQQFIPIQVAGRIPVDVNGMPARVDELIELTLKRL